MISFTGYLKIASDFQVIFLYNIFVTCLMTNSSFLNTSEGCLPVRDIRQSQPMDICQSWTYACHGHVTSQASVMTNRPSVCHCVSSAGVLQVSYKLDQRWMTLVSCDIVVDISSRTYACDSHIQLSVSLCCGSQPVQLQKCDIVA